MLKAPPLSVSSAPKPGFLSNVEANEGNNLMASNNMEQNFQSSTQKRKHLILFEFEAPVERGPKHPRIFESIGIFFLLFIQIIYVYVTVRIKLS